LIRFRHIGLNHVNDQLSITVLELLGRFSAGSTGSSSSVTGE
jgi:hypothetical protein